LERREGERPHGIQKVVETAIAPEVQLLVIVDHEIGTELFDEFDIGGTTHAGDVGSQFLGYLDR